jgi:hypothetical protein
VRGGIVALSAVLLAYGAAPAAAGHHWHGHRGARWHAVHHALYELENSIAFLEADPEVDDGFRAPIISRADARIARLRRSLPRPQWRWISPCCYSRPPLYIR